MARRCMFRMTLSTEYTIFDTSFPSHLCRSLTSSLPIPSISQATVMTMLLPATRNKLVLSRLSLPDFLKFSRGDFDAVSHISLDRSATLTETFPSAWYMLSCYQARMRGQFGLITQNDGRSWEKLLEAFKVYQPLIHQTEIQRWSLHLHTNRVP